jgi:hypothetical protein
MFAVVARLTALLGGDIDRDYCLKMWDGYPKTSEPDLLYGYTKVPLGPRAGRVADGEGEGGRERGIGAPCSHRRDRGSVVAPLCAGWVIGRRLTPCCGMAVLVRSLQPRRAELPRADGDPGRELPARGGVTCQRLADVFLLLSSARHRAA